MRPTVNRRDGSTAEVDDPVLILIGMGARMIISAFSHFSSSMMERFQAAHVVGNLRQ